MQISEVFYPASHARSPGDIFTPSYDAILAAWGGMLGMGFAKLSMDDVYLDLEDVWELRTPTPDLERSP